MFSYGYVDLQSSRDPWDRNLFAPASPKTFVARKMEPGFYMGRIIGDKVSRIQRDTGLYRRRYSSKEGEGEAVAVGAEG
jgi:hypothetical protein